MGDAQTQETTPDGWWRCPGCGAGNMLSLFDCRRCGNPNPTPPPPAAPAARAEGELFTVGDTTYRRRPDGRYWYDTPEAAGYVSARMQGVLDARAAAESAREAAERALRDVRAKLPEPISVLAEAAYSGGTPKKWRHERGLVANGWNGCLAQVTALIDASIAALAPAPGEATTGEVGRGEWHCAYTGGDGCATCLCLRPCGGYRAPPGEATTGEVDRG